MDHSWSMSAFVRLENARPKLSGVVRKITHLPAQSAVPTRENATKSVDNFIENGKARGPRSLRSPADGLKRSIHVFDVHGKVFPGYGRCIYYGATRDLRETSISFSCRWAERPSSRKRVAAIVKK
jgi:hypothetical protein